MIYLPYGVSRNLGNRLQEVVTHLSQTGSNAIVQTSYFEFLSTRKYDFFINWFKHVWLMNKKTKDDNNYQTGSAV